MPREARPPHSDPPRFPIPGELGRALELVRFLRAHCPWDAAQTARSLIPHLLEEAHEVVDAIGDENPEGLEGELGDLLLNLAFQIVVAEEKGDTDAARIYAGLEEKMVRRHPHLFGLGEERDWEASKAEERKEAGEEERGILAGLARGLDPLTKAHRIQEKVAGVGFDWDDHRGAKAKVTEELNEVGEAIAEGSDDAVEEELGDLLFAVVNLTRLAGAHPTTALDHANRKFRRRFQRLEEMARERDISLPDAGLTVLDELWNTVKAGE